MASDEPNGREWVVLLEAVDERGRARIDRPSFRRLITSWPKPGPTALYGPSRYALQVSVRAINAPSALSSAVWLWKDALTRTGLPDWQLVRAEILTPDELERDLQNAESPAGDAAVAPESVPDGAEGVAEELLRRALHDAVTGLPDRELFLDQLRRQLTAGVVQAAVDAVLVVDLGRSLGPAPPDTVVVEMARRLTNAVRAGDTVARVGPGQFALLVRLPHMSDPNDLARRIVASTGSPLIHDGRTITVSLGVGVATTAGSGDADDLIALAEAAMATS